MVKLRLKRMGRKKRPFYRIVVADSRSPRDGKNIEEIGYYNPLLDPPEIKVDLDRVDYWVSNGAKPSKTVSKLIDIHRENQEKLADETQDNEIEEKVEEADIAQEDQNNEVGADNPEEASYNMVNEAEELLTEGE